MFAVPAAEKKFAGTVAMSIAGLPFGNVRVGGPAALYNVTSEVTAVVPATHCTAEHAEKLVAGDCLASISRDTAGLPTGSVVGLGDGGIGGVIVLSPA
jgi:hypothetical protein